MLVKEETLWGVVFFLLLWFLVFRVTERFQCFVTVLLPDRAPGDGHYGRGGVHDGRHTNYYERSSSPMNHSAT